MGRTWTCSVGHRAAMFSSARHGVQSADQKLSRSSGAVLLAGAAGRVTDRFDGDVAERLGGAPVLPEPGQRLRLVRA